MGSVTLARLTWLQGFAGHCGRGGRGDGGRRRGGAAARRRGGAAVRRCGGTAGPERVKVLPPAV